MNIMVASVTKEYKLKNKAKSMFEEVANIVQDLVDSSKKVSNNYKVRAAEAEKLKEKYGRLGPDLKLINKLANKYLLRVSFDDNPNEMRLSISPHFPKHNIVSNIVNERGYGSIDFLYSFQVEKLKDFMPILDKKLKNKGYLIQEFFLTSSYAAVSITDKEGKKIRSGGYTYDDYHDRAMKVIDSASIEKYEDLSYDEFKRVLISKTFKKE